MQYHLYAYEERILEAESFNIKVYDWKFESSIKGLCIGKCIAIRKDLLMNEKNCILAEEIAHALLNIGDITDQRLWQNRKQERMARAYAYNRLLPVDKLRESLISESIYDAAENFDVTVDFINDALKYYIMKGLWL